MNLRILHCQSQHVSIGCSCYRMPQIELAIFWSAKKKKKKKKDAKTLFLVHPPFPLPGNFCNCNSGGICTASQLYAELPLLYTATSRDVLRERLQRASTKQLHCKAASMNRPILTQLPGIRAAGQVKQV